MIDPGFADFPDGSQSKPTDTERLRECTPLFPRCFHSAPHGEL